MKDAANKFIKFLKDKNLFEAFKTNFVNIRGGDGFASFEAWIKSTEPRNFILYAFSWDCASDEENSSEEENAREEEKWRAIHYKWQDFIKQDGAE